MENKSCIIEIKEIKINLCAICLENIKKEKKLVCNHSFCNSCILKWEKESNTCPICRSVIVKNEIKKNILNENKNNNIIHKYFYNLKLWFYKQIIFYTFCLGQSILCLILLWIIGTAIWKIIILNTH